MIPLAMARSMILLLLLLIIIISGGSAAEGDSPVKKPQAQSQSVIFVKIWCVILVFTVTFAGGISPYFMKWNEGFLVLGTQFAGGLFLGTALMHFLSDADAAFRNLTDVEYPFAFMLASAGYVIVMLMDCATSHMAAVKKGVGDKEGGGEGGLRDGDAVIIQGGNGSNNGGQSQSKAEEHAHDHSVKSILANSGSLGESILLILALCFHSIFEGIAIGVAETKVDAWKALWTVSIHKVFASIAMGVALLRMLPNRRLLSCVVYAFAFAISSPVGVAIGIIIEATTNGRVADWIYAISMGLACGIFIYVSINHLLSKGYKPQRAIVVDSPLGRWLAVVVGVGVAAIVMIWDT